MPNNIASKVDGNTDPESISENFKEIYSSLYNRTGTDEPLKKLLKEVDNAIVQEDMLDVQKVTTDLIREIIKNKIKSNN